MPMGRTGCRWTEGKTSAPELCYAGPHPLGRRALRGALLTEAAWWSGDLAADATDTFGHQGSTKLAEAGGRIVKNIKNSFSVFDAEPNPVVTGGVRDEEQRRGVHVASTG